jgi:hypothetical protein
VLLQECHEFGAEPLDVGIKGQLHGTPRPSAPRFLIPLP